jgi:folate-binding protein YgfZ
MTLPFNLSDGALFDLSDRAKVRVGGNDRLRFLNGQITNDVRKATPSTAIAACVLNAKGKMNAHVLVSSDDDSFFLDADPLLRDSLQPRLERYVIADDVHTEDASERLSLFHVLAPNSPSPPERSRMVSANRFGKAGWDIWIDATKHSEVLRELSGSFQFCDTACAEMLRIEQGIPRWDRELTEEIIPVEANLEESCIDYEKGCYIGQEVVSRMKMSGQRNKRLCGLIGLDDLPLLPGARLILAEKEVGWITSAIRSDRFNKEIALGYVKRGANSAGTLLRLANEARQLTVVDLPFTNENVVKFPAHGESHG